MSLARSASAAGLSINTGAGNALGAAFSQPRAPAGLFGSSNASANQPPSTTGAMATAGGLFGGSKPAATGPFGASTTAAAPASSGGGGLLGSAAATQQTQGSSGGLFGNKPAATATGGGGLFGNAAGQQQQAGGGLFGNAAANTQQQQQQPQQQQQSGGLFGQPAQTTTQQSGGGLFGASTVQPSTTTAAAPAATPGGGLFGQSQATPSGGLFGQSTAQPAQSTAQAPAVQINYDNLRPRSRFDDLAQPIQSEIALIDKGIQRVIKMRDEIGEFMPQHEKDIEQLGRDVQFVETKFKTVQDALNRDIQTVKVLQDMTKKNITDGQLSFKAADNLKLPAHYHQTSLFAGPPPPNDSSPSDATSAHAGAQDLITYFNRICDDVEKYKNRLDDYRSQIERDMPGVENGLYEQIRSFRDRSNAPVQDQLSQVLMALRETGSAIVAQAGQIADTRERLSRLQAGILDSGLYGMGMMS